MRERIEATITFLGGAGEIGASCALLEVADTTLLIDCGIRFKAGHALPDLGLLGEKRPDAIVLTHAHTDHSGGLPVVADAFAGTPVLATPPSCDLAMILIRDALKLMGTVDQEGDVPLYSRRQVESLVQALVPTPVEQTVAIKDVRLTFIPAGHILGAAMAHLETPAGNILFSGDYSVSPQLTVPALTRPWFPVDLVISEATYGNRLHEDRSAAERRLIGQVGEVLANEGRVLIPAFAIGRAQEVLLILKRALRRQELPAVPVFVDGMVRSVCNVYSRYERYASRLLTHAIRRDPHPFYVDTIRPVQSPEDRKRVLEAGPCVIVASSGMLNGGASTFYAGELASHERDAILITGYQDEESPGRALLELAGRSADAGPRQLELAGRTVDVRCRFDKYGLSAHADRLQMIGLLEALRPRAVVLVHGDGEAKQSLARGLSCRDVVLAENGLILKRGYRRRQMAATATTPHTTADAMTDATPPEMADTRGLPADVAAARDLLGPPGSVPLRAREVAEAWFGRRVRGELVQRLASRLEELGVVRRDDARRSLLWVLTPEDSPVLEEEAELAGQLKQENPKGRLLELCQRLRCAPPEAHFEVDGAFHVCRLSMSLGDRVFECEPQRAATMKTAEQLAARALLAILQDALCNEEAIAVGDEEATQLREANPKGALLEFCARRHLVVPDVEQRAIPGGHIARYRLQVATGGSPGIDTPWFRAATAMTAQQACASSLLEQLRAQEVAGVDLAARFADSKLATAVAADSSDQEPAAAPATVDRRPLLNQLRQVGLLRDFGYDQLACEGPPHAPVFVVEAWAVTEDGERVTVPPAKASSKKEAQLQAAVSLVAELVELGLTGKRGRC